MELSTGQIEAFRKTLFAYYDQEGRHMLPWRLSEGGVLDPYKIVVSELMLQQTQVGRVIPKYEEFLRRFPSARSLAAASLGDVLIMWQGLGYNRRAKFLWQAAQKVVADYGSVFPDTLEGLVSLPGIGKNTAGAVLAYAHNLPMVFIETNVRTVIIHHFFVDEATVSDKEIAIVLDQLLTRERPRDFYWAIMDYGTYLKKTVGNASTRSAHHVRQSPFEGSHRQVRGAVLRALTARGYSEEELAAVVPDARLPLVLQELQGEGMIGQTGTIYHLA
jgi:A/G-specific adenine glycosylase